jgi:hypothetical protein
MANTTIKITQLPSIGNGLSANTILPVVDTTGVAVTAKVAVGNIANFTLTEAGNLLPPALVSTIAYSVANSAQPNITSVGTLNVNTLRISGGTNGYFLQTNGNGNLAWTAPGGSGNGEVGGANTQIQFNDAGNFGGNAGLTFNKTTGVLTAPFADVSGVANIVGGGATVATKSVLNVASTFGSNSSAEPASAQAVRGRVTGSNLTKTRNYVTGVTGQYLITGTNASEFIKAGVLGVVGDQTTTADGAVVAYLDGDGGLTTANAAYAVSMKNSTPNSGFNYGLDLQFISLNLGGVTTSTFKQADIRFNNGVTLVANTANNISINANVTAGNVLTSAQVIANGVIESGTGFSTGGYLSVDGNTDLHNTVVTGNLSATGNITANNLGNIATLNLDGNVSNLLTGNGTYVAIPVVPTVGNIATLNLDGNVGNLLTGNGTYVAIPVVPTVGNIATINLTGSNSNVLYGNGVFAAVAGGNANTGNVTFADNIVIGTGDEFGGDGLFLAPGNGSIANGAVQYLRVRGGDYPTHIHLDTGNNQYYDQYFGADSRYLKLEANGNVVINADDYAANSGTWTFTTDGNLILADGNSVIQSIANSSLDTLNPNVSTMVLTPDPGYGSQALVLDPTLPGHIHLRAPGANIDEPTANLFLGGEDTAFEITSGANNQAVIHSNGKAWTFGDDGNISSDTLTFTTTFANVKTVEYQTAGVWDLYVEDGITGSNTAISRLNVSFKDNLIDKPQVYIENTKESDGIALRWTFDENGNLNFPRDVAGNSDPYLNIFGGSTPTIQSTDVSLAGPANLAIQSDYLNLSGSTGNRIILQADAGAIATDAAMVLSTNLADPGNIVSWTLDTTGNLTLPDTTSVIANVSITLEANDTGNITGLSLIGDANANLYAHGNVTIVSDSSNTNATWAFGNNGNLTLPGNLVIAGNTNVFGTDAALIQSTGGLPIIAISSGANGAIATSWVEDVANIGTSNIASVYANPTVGSKIVRIAVGQNGGPGPNLWDFNANGTTTFPGNLISSGASPAPSISGFNSISGITVSASGNVTGNYILGNGSQLTNVATSTTGNWTLASGVNTVSISVPLNGTYSIWINGNIPNGIVTYTATVVVTNTNVPVVGSSYGWYYAAGNALVLTSIPTQIVGTVNNISNAVVVTTTANVFTFGITNNSGNTAVVNYGYTKL